MKNRWGWIILSVILICWALPAHSVIYIEGDQDGQSGIRVIFVDQDDPNDNDDNIFAEKKVFVDVKNDMRRYLGMYVDRRINGGEPTEIDNGPNDRIIGPATELISLDTIANFFNCLSGNLLGEEGCEILSSNRRYILPLPDNVEPGDELHFSVRASGLAIGKQIPFSFSGNSADPWADQFLEGAARTYFELVAFKLIGLAVGGTEAFTQFLTNHPNEWDTLLKELVNIMKSELGLWESLENGQAQTFFWDIFKLFVNSSAFQNVIKDMGYENAGNLIAKAKKIFFLADAFDFANIMIQLTTSRWLETYNVVLIVSEVESLSPMSGATGDIITIYGKGFDYTDPHGNLVYFCDDNLNPNLEAFVLEASPQMLRVQVPEGFNTGPVMVCVDEHCSNWDVIFSEGVAPSLSITSPLDGDNLSGMVTVEVEVSSPPDPLPSTDAVLYVDGVESERRSVSDALFAFSLDTESLEEGEHSLAVRIEFAPPIGNLSSEILVIEVENDDPPGPQPGSHIYVDASGVTQDNWFDYLREYYVDWEDHNEPIERIFHLPTFGTGPAFYVGGAAYYFIFTVHAWLERLTEDQGQTYYTTLCGSNGLGLPGRQTGFYINEYTGGPMYIDHWVLTNQYFPCSWGPTTYASYCDALHYSRTSRIRFQVRMNITTCVTSP